MDQVAKVIPGRIQPLSASVHIIPTASVTDSIRDFNLEEKETALLIATTTTTTTTTTTAKTTILTDSSAIEDTLINPTTSFDDLIEQGTHTTWSYQTSPKYSSPPIGSGGKYMVMSKRASWIDANACDIFELSPSSSSSLTDQLVARQRQSSIPDNRCQQQLESSLPVVLSEVNNTHKSGSLSLLHSNRQSTLEQQKIGSPSSSPSSSTLASHALPSEPKYRRKSLHITTSSMCEPASRHRILPFSSIVTGSTTPVEDDDGSHCSSAASYYPSATLSPSFITQDKDKLALLHGHSPGSSSPLSSEISSTPSHRNSNYRRRSSLSLMKNIPSANNINGYTGSKPGDTTGSRMVNNVSRTNQSTSIDINSTIPSSSVSLSVSVSTPPITTSSSRLKSIPCTPDSDNGVPAYQHSLHSFFKRQLSEPKTSCSTNPSDENDRDVVEIDLNNNGPTCKTTTPLDGASHSFSSTVYPALFLGGSGQDTDGRVSSSSRIPSLYINTSGLLHTSTPELQRLDDTMNYFDLHAKEGKDTDTPLSAPGNRTKPINAHATYLYHSRLRKISKWCIFKWNDSKSFVFIWVRQQLDSQKPFKLLAKLPASDDTDLVNKIPWTNWIDEYQQEHHKPLDSYLFGRSSAVESSEVQKQGLSKSYIEQKRHYLSLDLKHISTELSNDEDYPYHPLDTSFSSGKIATPISADDSSTLSSRRVSTSSSHLAGRSSSSYPPSDYAGSVGYCFQDNGNRMGTFGRIGGGISTILDEKMQSSPSSASMHIRHTIKSRLQAAKSACNNEIRIIMDGLNEYVERGLRYVECLEEDLEQGGPFDESDDHDDQWNSDYRNDNISNDSMLEFSRQEPSYCIYHPLRLVCTDLTKPSQQGLCSSPGIELPQLSSSPANNGIPFTLNSNNIPVRRRSLAIRLQNIEEQAELSSSETDQSQVTTPSDERLPKQMMMKSIPQQTVNQHIPTTNAPSLVSQEYIGDLQTSKAPQPPSRYAVISEDTYLPTPFILTLQELITLAQTVMDNPLEVYLENNGGCAVIVSRIQSIGTQWEAHPQWPCREWYVRLLLCVAAFNRVVEWWEVERGFWFSRNTASGSGPSGGAGKYCNTHSMVNRSTRTCTGGNGLDTDDTEDTESSSGARYRSISESESAWSYMESQDDTLSKSDGLHSKDLYYSENNSISGECDHHHHDSYNNNINTSSAVLQEAVKRGQSNTIVMELALETTIVQYVSPVWREVIGSDSQEIIGKDISDLMVPGDQRVFSAATNDLLKDTLRTTEVQFSVRPEEATVIEMEGKGMVMYNRVTGEPSHTMWVIKPLSHQLNSTPSIVIKRLSMCPVNPSQDINSSKDVSTNIDIQQYRPMHPSNTNDDAVLWPTVNDGDMSPFGSLRIRSISEPVTIARDNVTTGFGSSPHMRSDGGDNDQQPFLQQEKHVMTSNPSATVMRRAISHGGVPTLDNPLLSPAALLSLPPVLCRVCERLVVAAFFEQHSELCVEMHRTEMDVIICNDSLQELKHLVQELTGQSKSTVEPEDASLNDGEVSCMNQNYGTGYDGLGNDLLDYVSDGLAVDCDAILGGTSDKFEGQKLDNVIMCKELLEILDVALSIPIPDTQNEDGYDDKDTEVEIDGSGACETRMHLEKSKMVQILYWRPPPVDDPMYHPLIHDVANLTKAKVDTINRMRDRLEFNERVRLDFQQYMQQGKGWTEYVNEDMVVGYSSTLHPDGDIATVDQVSDNNVASTTANKSKPRKSIISHLKNWNSKRSKRLSRAQRRKSHSIKVRPHIVEMETIDTPLASPNIQYKMESPRVPTTAKHSQPPVPTSANSNTSSSTNKTPHRSLPPSIKDYDIIKPISKGAFGSVFLAKKRLTGDYYAIKFLKKSDMIAKNQVTNVKAERMILMTQTDSPFVTKLYYTFQSKDYLYLVLEYLNGGDCSTLIKTLGRLPEEWARNYLAEVTLGLGYLYNKNIIHRDLKPDNLLIDQNGHLKLTDFGLSRIGFLDRRVRDELSYGPYSNNDTPQPTSPAPSRSNTPPLPLSPTVSCGTNLPSTFSNLYKHSYFSAIFERDRQRRGSHASSSSSCGGGDHGAINDYSPRFNHQQYATSYSSSAASTPGWMDEKSSFSWHRSSNSGIYMGKSPYIGHGKASPSYSTEKINSDTSSAAKRQTQYDFRAIGTPDYIAPESILGTGHDSMVDWWALGVICYEFLYGYPPFNDDSPDKVFENILSRRIDWHEKDIDVSADAHDFMEKLMTLDPNKRLGANGPEEVKLHPFFKDIDWDHLLAESPSFVPQPAGEEDTVYFDTRGATMQDHHIVDEKMLLGNDREEVEHVKAIIKEQNPAKVTPIFENNKHGDRRNANDSMNDRDPNDTNLLMEDELGREGTNFGTFMYKNLPLLEKANEDAIRKIRHDSIVINASSPSSPSTGDLLPSVSKGSGGNDTTSVPATNWFYRSLPAISRKKRNSIFDLAPGSSSINRPSASSSSSSSSSSSLHHFAFTTSLPTTPSNLSPSTSAKIMSTSPPQYIPIVSPRNYHNFSSNSSNVNTNVKFSKENKGKSTLFNKIDPHGNSSRFRSMSSPGNRLYNLTGSRITKPFADIMHEVHSDDPDDLGGRRSSPKGDHCSTCKPSWASSSNSDTEQHQSYHHKGQQHQELIEDIAQSIKIFDSTRLDIPTTSKHTLDCLVADDNPISCKILETILDRLHCRCVIVRNGAQAIRSAMGDVQFDLIFMDIRMPIIDGEAAARMIKSIKNLNQNTPIIAVTAYERTVKLADTFNDIISKPVTRQMVQQRIRSFCHPLNDGNISSTSSPLQHPHEPCAMPTFCSPSLTQPILIPPPY